MDVPLDVVLPRSVEATFRVTSASGQPLPGMRVRVWPGRSSVLPGLQDVNPGDWIADYVLSSACGITDGAGEVTLRGLRSGQADVSVDLDTALGSDVYLRSLYPEVRQAVDIGPEALFTCVAPAPRNITLVVLERGTDAPVDEFELSLVGVGEMSINVLGNIWQGWTSAAASGVGIVVPGLGSATLEIPTESDTLRAYVGPGSRTMLRLEGMPDGTLPATINVSILREEEGGLFLVGSREVSIDSEGKGWLAVDEALSNLRFGVGRLEAGGRILRFEPEVQQADEAGEVRFRVVP
jgi:hypothetical protein